MLSNLTLYWNDWKLQSFRERAKSRVQNNKKYAKIVLFDDDVGQDSK